MNITDLCQNLIPLDKLADKTIDQISFKEAICLVFHAVNITSTDPELVDSDTKIWKQIYEEFLTELSNQRLEQWPQLEIIRNDGARRIDILTLTKPFTPSENICMLLFRLLYIESYKRPYVFKAYKYHRILSHRFKNTETARTQIRNTSIKEIFDLVVAFVKYYVNIYDDSRILENALGTTILRLITTDSD